MVNFQEAASIVLGNSSTVVGMEDALVAMPHFNWRTIFRFPKDIVERFEQEGLIKHRGGGILNFDLPKLLQASGMSHEEAGAAYNLGSGTRREIIRTLYSQAGEAVGELPPR